MIRPFVVISDMLGNVGKLLKGMFGESFNATFIAVITKNRNNRIERFQTNHPQNKKICTGS